MAHTRLSVLFLVVCACSARAQNAISLPANCSDEPAQWSGPLPQLPEVPAPKPGKGSLIGTVRDRNDGSAVQSIQMNNDVFAGGAVIATCTAFDAALCSSADRLSRAWIFQPGLS